MFQPIAAQLFEDSVEEEQYNPPRLILIFSVDPATETIFFQDDQGRFHVRRLDHVHIKSMVRIQQTGIVQPQ